ncbi:MAG: hypothetical protein EBR32_04280 [Bacteroidetes bacterium]|nr:hypothetical protein [Bacteroidota bacterium]
MNLYRYNSPYHSQFLQAKGSMGRMRSGYILEWRGPSFTAVGECAPLEGFSKENLLDGLHEYKKNESKLRNILEKIQNQFPKPSLPTLDEINIWEKELTGLFNQNYPSLSFGLSTVLYDWLSQVYQIPLHKLFMKLGDQNLALINYPAHEATVPVNALLPILEIDECLLKIKEIVTEGFTAVKLKVSSDHEDTLNVLSRIKSIAPKIRLRLDANAQWSSATFLPWAHQYAKLDLDYIEQPFPEGTFEAEVQSCHQAEIPLPDFAADESCAVVSDFYHLLNTTTIPYYVLKPTLIGGISDIMQMILDANTKGATCILSSSFDGIVSRKVIASLAWFSNFVKKNRLAHGLDTGKWLVENYGSPEFLLIPEIQKGAYSLEQIKFEKVLPEDSILSNSSQEQQSLHQLISVHQLEPISIDTL